MAAKSDSALEQTTGSGKARRSRTPPLNGSGIGIAVLDSGVMKNHLAFVDSAGGKNATRIIKSVNFTELSDVSPSGSKKVKDWKGGIDVSDTATYSPKAAAELDGRIDNSGSTFPDEYGHGTFVAGVAAGVAIQGAPEDVTGTATGANIIDVKVLNADGVGDTSDILAGIDWVIANARNYNIRVMNLSLASDSI